jgi:hypothetical protein
MQTWEKDRIYTFICAALALNNDPTRKYLFDKADNIFFNLKYENGKYSVDKQKPLMLTDHYRTTLLRKIEKLNESSRDIFVINKLERQFDLRIGSPTKDMEEYNRRDKLWKELMEQVQIFLTKNNIDIEKTVLIE